MRLLQRVAQQRHDGKHHVSGQVHLEAAGRGGIVQFFVEIELQLAVAMERQVDFGNEGC